jgi:hypothetical protein
MRDSNNRHRPLRTALLALGLLAGTCAAGCQVDVGGQVLPSPWYMGDDVQYFPTGPEFKHAQEAAVLKQAAQEQSLRQ